MASIRKRTWPSGKVTYQLRWIDDNGDRQTETFDRRRDAEQQGRKLEGQLVTGTYIDPNAGRQRFIDFADEWAEAQDGWKASSRESWENNRKRLVAIGLDRVELADIDQLTLKAWRRQLREHPYALSTTNQTMAYVAMVLKAAALNNRIARNPAAGLPPLRARADERDERVRPEDVPTTAEAVAILTAAPDLYRAAVALGISGLRRGEILGLSVDRVDLDRRLVTVDRQLSRVNNCTILTTPKREKTRTIEVPAAVAFELRRHLRDHCDRARQWDGPGGPAVLLFQGRVGTTPCVNPQQFYDSAWRPALTAAGFDPYRFKPHALRHYCASSLLAGGADVATVAGHLGDTVESVSRHYAHWLRDQRGVPAAILDRMLAPDQSGRMAR